MSAVTTYLCDRTMASEEGYERERRKRPHRENSIKKAACVCAGVVGSVYVAHTSSRFASPNTYISFSAPTHTHKHIHTYTYTNVCVQEWNIPMYELCMYPSSSSHQKKLRVVVVLQQQLRRRMVRRRKKPQVWDCSVTAAGFG
jgi:hypothetical protein